MRLQSAALLVPWERRKKNGGGPDARMNQQQLTSDDDARMQQQVPAPRATERASPHTVLRSRWFRETSCRLRAADGAGSARSVCTFVGTKPPTDLPSCLSSFLSQANSTDHPIKKKIHGPQGWLLLLTSSHGQPSPMLDQPVCHCSQNKNRQKNYLD